MGYFISQHTKEECDKATLGFELAGGLEFSSSGLSYFGGADVQNKQITLRATISKSSVSEAWLDSSITHSGKYSLAFTKVSDGEIQFHVRVGSAYEQYLKTNGFTFWIYSTVQVNGTPSTAANIIADIDSNNEPKYYNNGAGMVLEANTWTQITVRPEDMSSSGRFLIIKGSTAGTIYIDDIQPLPAE